MTDIPSQSRQGRVVLPIVLVALFVVVVCALVMFFHQDAECRTSWSEQGESLG